MYFPPIWFDVKNYIPKDNQEVLVTNGKRIWIAQIKSNQWHWESPTDVSNITHWTLLPAVPCVTKGEIRELPK